MNNESFLRQVGEKPFSAEETKTIINDMLAGRFSQAQTMAYLTGSAERRPTVPEIVGGAQAMRSQMRTITASAGAIDLCGTGGDGLGTLNISTAVSFVVAAAGVTVAKHGNRSRSSKSGAADVLESLGVKIDLEPRQAEQVLAKIGLVFLFAPAYHPAMRHVDQARREIGQRTIFNLLGPLTNPAGVKRQLTGVFGHEWLMPYAEALRALGAEHAMVVHGEGGWDELTTTGVTHVATVRDGVIRASQIAPEDAGLKRARLDDLKGGTPDENAQALKAMLAGASGAYRDIVVLNAAAALMVAERVPDIMAGAGMAAAILDSGQARAKLEELILVSNAP